MLSYTILVEITSLRLLLRRRISAEDSSESLKSDSVVAGGVCLQSNRAAVAHFPERRGDCGIVDLACARLTPAWHIGDLNLADERVRALEQLDQVPFTDLCVVEVDHHPQPRPRHGLDERERVVGTGEWGTGVVERSIEVLQAECHTRALTQLGEAVQRPVRVDPHRAGDFMDGAQRHPVRAELGAEHQQTGAAKALGDREGLLCTAKQGFGAVFIEKVASCVPHHRRKLGARADQRVDVVTGPVPDFDLESGLGDPPDSFFKWQVQEDHFRTDGQLEHRELQSGSYCCCACQSNPTTSTLVARPARSSSTAAGSSLSWIW